MNFRRQYFLEQPYRKDSVVAGATFLAMGVSASSCCCPDVLELDFAGAIFLALRIEHMGLNKWDCSTARSHGSQTSTVIGVAHGNLLKLDLV
jgi:hypothetical protein